MLKPQMLEALFVAGSVLAGMTGQFWAKAPALLANQTLIRIEVVTAPRAPAPLAPRFGLERWMARQTVSGRGGFDEVVRGR